MGGSSSKSTVYQESNQLIVNKSDIDLLNKTMNQLQVDTIMKDAQKCSAGIAQDQLIELSNVETTGKISIGASQKQSANLTFSCVNQSKVRNDIVSKMINNIMEKLETNADTDILNKMAQVARTKATSGAISPPWGKADTKSDLTQKFNTTSVTDVRKNLKNIVENAVSSTFTVDNVKSCIASANNTQVQRYRNLKGESLDFFPSQEQAATVIADCINASDVSNKITSGLTKYLDIQVRDDTSTKSKTEGEQKAETEAKKKGVIDETGDAVASAAKGVGDGIGTAAKGIGDGIGNIFRGLFGSIGKMFGGGTQGQLSSLVSSCCCLFIIILVALFYLGIIP
jgi:hypothetical protein